MFKYENLLRIMQILDSNEYGGGVFQKRGKNSDEDLEETDYEKILDQEASKNPTKRRFLKS